MNPDRYHRSFDVLGLLVEYKAGLRLTEIKNALGLPVSRAHNLLQTMVAAEMLTLGPGHLYAAIHVSVIGRRAAKTHERRLIGAAQHYASQVKRSPGHFKPTPIVTH